YLDQFELSYQIKDTGEFTPCADPRSARVDDTTLDISCATSDVVTQVTLSGFIVRKLCSLYISGGRNVALKQASDQLGIYREWFASNAVDGDPGIPEDLASLSSTCSHTARDARAFWRVTFLNDVEINRFIIYNRRQAYTHIDCCMKRLVNFTLEASPGPGESINYTYTDPGGPAQSVYTVVPTPQIGFSVKTVLIHVRKNRIDAIVTLCEVYAFGEVACPEGKFGRQCERDCNCADQTEACFVSTGGCPSGCAAGYTGEDCYTPCDDGAYGPGCNQTCSANCAQSTSVCNRVDGVCNGGCKPGYQAPLCTEPCPVGQFGRDCLQSCSDNCAGRDIVCNHISGDCDSGCDPGYKTKHCNVSCEPGTYGRDCMGTCSDHCAGESRSCHFVTGFCDQGCETGYMMPLCIHEKTLGESGQLEIGIIIGVFSTVAAAVAVAAVVLVVFLRRQRKANVTLGHKSRDEEVKAYQQSDLPDGNSFENSQVTNGRSGQRDQHVYAESVLAGDGIADTNDHSYEEEGDHYDRPGNFSKGGPYEIPLSVTKSAQSRDKTKNQRERASEGKGHSGVADENQAHVNTYDGDDGLFDDPQTNGDTNDEGSHDGLLDDPKTNIDTNGEGSHDLQTKSDTNGEGSHDRLLDDLQTKSDTNDEGSHDKLLDDPQTNGDANDENSHDKLLDDPQTNADTNEGVQEGCNDADGQPLLNNDSKNLERLILCLAENENTYVYKELPEGKNFFFITDNTENGEKRKRGDKSVFWDDRGAWTNGVTNKSLFVQKED
ncbi:multiple epidermal growth factor-like domains 10, partial [Plakobranchus ocellatus]